MDNFEYGEQIGEDHFTEDEYFDSIDFDGIEYEVGDLVKFSVTSNHLDCEQRAVIVAPIKRIVRRPKETDGWMSPAVSFAHLAVDVDKVSKVTEDTVRQAWEAYEEGDDVGVLIRWHTGHNSECPACTSAEHPFAHLSTETPNYFTYQMEG